MTTTRTTDRWRGVVALALFAGAVGIVARRPLLLLSAVVAVAFAVYPRVSPTPPVALDLERAVEETASPGESVEVTVTLRNVGERTLPDVRIVDGVPPMLSVASGSARHAAVLRPGAATTFSYEVAAAAGRHQFDPATVLVRDASGATEVETTVGAETEIDCTEAVPDAPLRRQTDARVGPVATDDGGSGVEFFRTRDYRPGDPMSRVDWNRLARTGELTTVDFREERAASVVVCIDARREAYRAREDEPNAVAYGAAAAESLSSALFGTRQRVGLAAVGREFCWLPPGTGDDHAARLRELLGTHPTLSAVPPSEDGAARSATSPAEARADGGMLGEVKRTSADQNSGGSERDQSDYEENGRERSDRKRRERDDEDSTDSNASRDSNTSRDLDPEHDAAAQVTELKKRLAADAQVVWVSPLADEFAVRTALDLEAAGTAVTVLSPNPTDEETVGGRLARVERENRVHALRRSGVPVVDWDPDDPLATAVAAAQRRRSA